MTGLSFIVGNEEIICKSKEYPKRSYYCNLYMQYEYFEKTGEMHFTPPVQTIYATCQALKEYFEEGEENKFARHRRVFDAIHSGIEELGFKYVIDKQWQSGWLCLFFILIIQIGILTKYIIIVMNVVLPFIREK